MKQKLLALKLLFAASFILLGAILALIFIRPSAQEPEQPQFFPVTDISVADIGAMAVTNESGTFGLMCYGVNVELLTPDGGETTNYSQSELRSLVYAACHLTALRQLSAETDPVDCGLNSPSATVVLMGNDGSDTRFSILDQYAPDGSYYLYSETDGRVYLIEEKIASLFLRSSRDFVAHEVFPVVPASDLLTISQISLHRGEQSYTIENQSGAFYLTSPVYHRLRSSAVYSSLVTTLGILYGDNCLTLSEGLESLDVKEEFSFSMKLGEQEYAAAFAQKDGSWLMENLSTGAVYRIDEDAVLALPLEMTELLQGNPYYYSLGDCRSLLIQSPERELFFEISGSGEEISAVCGDQVLDAQAVTELSKVVNGAELGRAVDHAEGEAALTLTFTLHSGSRETVEFVPMGGEYAVRINGICNFSASAYSVEQILKSANLYQ